MPAPLAFNSASLLCKVLVSKVNNKIKDMDTNSKKECEIRIDVVLVNSLHKISATRFASWLWCIRNEVRDDLNRANVCLSISRQCGKGGIWILRKALSVIVKEQCERSPTILRKAGSKFSPSTRFTTFFSTRSGVYPSSTLDNSSQLFVNI